MSEQPLRLLAIASRPSDLVEMAALARALGQRGHALTLMYFFERADPSVAGAFASLDALQAAGVDIVRVDHETARPESGDAPDAGAASSPAVTAERGAALGRLRAVATWLRSRGLNVYPGNSRVSRAAYQLARDFDGMRDRARWATTVEMVRSRRDAISALGITSRVGALRRIHQGAAMVLHYREFWRLFADTIARRSVDALLLPEDIVGKVWPVAIAAGHERGVPALVVPYTLANRSEAIQGLKGLGEFQTANNRVAARLYPRWRYQDAEVDLIRLPSPHVLAHEELGISPPDPWMMNSGFADKILVDSAASFDYFSAGGIPPGQMAIVGSVSQDAMFEQRRHRDDSLRALRAELAPGAVKPLLLISGCPNQLSAPVPHCEFRTMDDLARFVGESVAPLADHYHLVVRPHPNYTEFGAMLEPFGVKTSMAPTSSLVPLADVFIAFASATIRWAIACAIPTINYDVFHYGYGDFAAATGVAAVSGSAEFRSVARSLTPGAARLQALAANARADSERWSMMDGAGVARIEHEVRQACRRRATISSEHLQNA